MHKQVTMETADTEGKPPVPALMTSKLDVPRPKQNIAAPAVKAPPAPVPTTPEGKHPLMLLNEVYREVELEVEYVPDETTGSNYRASTVVEGRQFNAVGKTKKEAKVNCAIHALDVVRRSGMLAMRLAQMRENKVRKVQKFRERQNAGGEAPWHNKPPRIGTQDNPVYKPLYKNAIMKLNERMRGLDYQLIAEHGTMFNKTITVSVTVDGCNYLGTARTKQKAKCEAAEKVLRALGWWSAKDEKEKLAEERNQAQDGKERLKRKFVNFQQGSGLTVDQMTGVAGLGRGGGGTRGQGERGRGRGQPRGGTRGAGRGGAPGNAGGGRGNMRGAAGGGVSRGAARGTRGGVRGGMRGTARGTTRGMARGASRGGAATSSLPQGYTKRGGGMRGRGRAATTSSYTTTGDGNSQDVYSGYYDTYSGYEYQDNSGGAWDAQAGTTNESSYPAAYATGYSGAYEEGSYGDSSTTYTTYNTTADTSATYDTTSDTSATYNTAADTSDITASSSTLDAYTSGTYGAYGSVQEYTGGDQAASTTQDSSYWNPYQHDQSQGFAMDTTQ